MASNATIVNGWLAVGKTLPTEPCLLTDRPQTKMLFGLILEELIELSQSTEDGVSIMEELLIERIQDIQGGKVKQLVPSIEGCLDALVDIEVVTHNVTAHMGLSGVYQPNFSRVMHSNYTKFLTNIEDVEASIKSYEVKGIKVYGEFYDNRNLYVIKREDGKVMKGIHYKEPVLTLDIFVK